MNIIEFLKGKKTYILVAIGVIIFALNALGYIPNELATKIYELLGLGSVATLRTGMKK